VGFYFVYPIYTEIRHMPICFYIWLNMFKEESTYLYQKIRILPSKRGIQVHFKKLCFKLLHTHSPFFTRLDQTRINTIIINWCGYFHLKNFCYRFRSRNFIRIKILIKDQINSIVQKDFKQMTDKTVKKTSYIITRSIFCNYEFLSHDIFKARKFVQLRENQSKFSKKKIYWEKYRFSKKYTNKLTSIISIKQDGRCSFCGLIFTYYSRMRLTKTKTSKKKLFYCFDMLSATHPFCIQNPIETN